MAISTEPIEAMIRAAADRGQKALSEYDSKRLLARYGVPVVPEELVRDSAGAVQAAGRLGYPVAVKACGPTLMHKSDQGLVALNLGDAAAVKAAVGRIKAATGKTALDGYLVQPMIHGKREVIVGALRDKLFGPCVMLGVGGIFVEAVGDVAFRLAPLEPRDALEMIVELRAQRLFEAVRGEPAVDREALSQALVAAGRVLLENPSVTQIDINPLIFQGPRPVAVDALVTL